MPPRSASAPSPADMQPTMPAQPLNSPRAVAPGVPRPPQQQPRTIAPPQRVPAASERTPAETPPQGRGKRWWLLVGAAAVAVLVLLGVVIGLVRGGTDNSPEAQVKGAISVYTEALADGDLDQLRGITCGSQHDFYQNISAEQFAGVYRTSKEQKSIPVIDRIDAVRITGDTAMAQATVHTEADPSNRSQRTFDLQHTDDGWKVCDPPTTPH
ncbi:nuclear transport factor 2 family protein [Nocardia sp. NPDC050406]|uniref:Rv0361 family membrane protein n=1 Tax=Nocardia sp. NPDC050406 TaxID=3364318 RepID=UPI00379B13ED